MSKANQQARFAVFNFFDVKMATKLERQVVYLDYNEIIARISQVKQALLDIKARKREEKHIINMINKAVWTRIHLKPPKYQTRKDYIQRGFNIAEKWKADDDLLNEIIAIGMKELKDENKT